MMVTLFDYIFYRVYKFFQKKDNFIPDTKASATLSLMQFFTLLDILVFVRIMYPFSLPNKMYVLPVILILGGLNWYRYERNFNIEELENRWSKEDSARRKKNGWFIVLYLVASFLILGIYGTITN